MSTMSVLPAPSIQLARSLQALTVEEVASMSAYDLFQKQLESGSAEAANDAMKRLSVVAVTLGIPATKANLLPYLTALVQGQPTPQDELLLLMGQELVKVVTFCGANTPAEHFIPILERLAAVEETVVREQAVVVLGHVARQAPPADGPLFVALLKRLATADWFTPKVSAAGIAPAVLGLPSVPPHAVAELLTTVYKDLCHDETPMVRRAAAQHWGKVLNAVGVEYKDSFAALTLPKLATDEQDSVRRLAVASLGDVGPAIGDAAPHWTAQHWLPLIKDASTDLSWRVRHNLAKHFSAVALSLGIQKDRRLVNEQSLVMACFVALLTDAEAEVRAAAVCHLARMVSWGGQGHFVNHLQPLLPALADDVVMEVRSKCALALMDAAHGGALEDNLILSAFGPLLESFLQDEFHEVQLQVLTNLHKISHLLPGLSGVVTALMQMSKATNWRVREAVAQLLPHLAEARGMDFFVSVLLEPAWLTLLLDSVASVRLAIMRGMALLVKVAGDDWTLQTLLPHHIRIYNQHASSYLIRNTLLQGHVEALKQASGALQEELLRQVVRGLKDKVANVRMVTANCLIEVLNQGAVVTAVKPHLEEMAQNDTDFDVRHSCQKALESIV